MKREPYPLVVVAGSTEPVRAGEARELKAKVLGELANVEIGKVPAAVLVVRAPVVAVVGTGEAPLRAPPLLQYMSAFSVSLLEMLRSGIRGLTHGFVGLGQGNEGNESERSCALHGDECG